MELKFNAMKIDQIEKIKKQPIEQCIADTTINNIVIFVQKGLSNEREDISRDEALEEIDEYLKEKDKDDLVLDIMDALINAGFLSRQIDMSKIRQEKTKAMQDAMKNLK